MSVKRKAPSFNPVVVYDAMGYARLYWIAAEREGEIVRLLMADTTRYDLFTRDILIGQMGELGSPVRYVCSQKEVSEVAARMKISAMQFGATPEAIRLLGLVCPLTKEEEVQMAKEKLAPKADKEGLKAAAKAAPVGGKKADAAPKQRGNPEALAKAREANTAKLEELKKDKRKITATEKGKSKLAKVDATDKLSIMIKAKTVGAAITGGDVAFRDIAYAEKVGLIELA